jgi:hypothetical protein
MRWPLLAEYLKENPQQVAAVVHHQSDEIQEDHIRELSGKQIVRDIIQGKGVSASLDPAYVEQIVKL